MVSEEKINKMIQVAKESRENAFMPRSGHKIGACILTTDGEYFGGCNTENIISGLGVCAEVSAVNHAVLHGKYEFEAICAVDETQTYPCGSCLQYLIQFYQINDQDIEVIVSDTTGNFLVTSVLKLLPHGYLTQSNLETIKSFKNKTTK